MTPASPPDRCQGYPPRDCLPETARPCKGHWRRRLPVPGAHLRRPVRRPWPWWHHAWRVLPGGQAECGAPDSTLAEQVRNRIGEIRAGLGREIRSRRLDDAPQRKLVDDYEDDWYFPGQEPAP